MPEPRMSAQLARLAKKRGRLPALVTALGLGLFVSLQQFLASLASFVRRLGYPADPSGPDISEVNFWYFQPDTDYLLFFVLPLTLGVFLALWVIAPISDELTLRFVLTRAGLASAAGALLVIVFQTFQGLFASVGARWEGNGISSSWPPPPGSSVNFEVFGQNTLDALASGVGAFIFETPKVMLAGVLLWLWLREHPRDYAVAGLIDEL